MGGAQTGARQHRDGQFGDHAEVESDTVALLDAEIGEAVGDLTDLFVQLLEGDDPGVAGLTLPVEGDLVAPGLQMAIEAVVRDVQLSVGEPLEERCLGIVEDLLRLLEPGDPLQRLLLPEAKPVLLGLFVDLEPSVRLSDELVRRRELLAPRT